MSTVTGRHDPRIPIPRSGTPASSPALAGNGSTTAAEKHLSGRELALAVTVGHDTIRTLTRETDGTIDILWQ